MKTKGVITFISLFLVIALIAGGLGWVTQGFKEWNPEKWFPKEDKTLAVDNEGNPLTPGKTYKMPSSMTFLSAMSNEGITLETTVTGSGDFTLDWSLSWIDPDSEWASDKTVTDYLNVAPYDNNSAAVVTCLDGNGFSERIRITVSLRDNPNVNAFCTVDFMQRVYYGGYRYNSEYSIESVCINTNNLEPDILSMDFSATEGTVRNTKAITAAGIRISPEFYEYLCTQITGLSLEDYSAKFSFLEEDEPVDYLDYRNTNHRITYTLDFESLIHGGIVPFLMYDEMLMYISNFITDNPETPVMQIIIAARMDNTAFESLINLCFTDTAIFLNETNIII